LFSECFHHLRIIVAAAINHHFVWRTSSSVQCSSFFLQVYITAKYQQAAATIQWPHLELPLLAREKTIVRYIHTYYYWTTIHVNKVVKSFLGWGNLLPYIYIYSYILIYMLLYIHICFLIYPFPILNKKATTTSKRKFNFKKPKQLQI